MSSVATHYETLHAPAYLWRAGGLEHASALGSTDLADVLHRGTLTMTRGLEFDVFGKIISAELTDAGWRLFFSGAEGKRSPVDIVVPAVVTEHELAQYLDDIFHEWASPDRPCVKRISN